MFYNIMLTPQLAETVVNYETIEVNMNLDILSWR